MAETTDGILIVLIAGIPDTTEVHIRTQVNHAEWTCSGAEVKKTGIGSIYHDFYQIRFPLLSNLFLLGINLA